MQENKYKHNIISLVETDAGIFLHTDIVLPGIYQSKAELRLMSKTGEVVINYEGVPFASGQFTKNEIVSLTRAPIIVLCFISEADGSMLSCYLKGGDR